MEANSKDKLLSPHSAILMWVDQSFQLRVQAKTDNICRPDSQHRAGNGSSARGETTGILSRAGKHSLSGTMAATRLDEAKRRGLKAVMTALGIIS